MTINLDTLRTTVENAGEAWADGEHIDIITPPTVLELIERAEAAERALDFHSQRDRELKTTLSMISDRLDEHSYDELSSLIEDEPLDQWGELYKSRLEQAEQAVERVRETHRPVDVEPSETICHACSTLRGNGDSLRYFPYKEWPCDTIRALDGDGRG